MSRLSFHERAWTDVPGCVRISSSECNVTSAGAGDPHGCTLLRVRAVRRGLASEPVQACSKFGEQHVQDRGGPGGGGEQRRRPITGRNAAFDMADLSHQGTRAPQGSA